MKSISTNMTGFRKETVAILAALGFERFGAVEFGRFLSGRWEDYNDIQLDEYGNLSAWTAPYSNVVPLHDFLAEAVRRKLVAKPKTIKLNSEYSAIVGSKQTKVGCQTFENSKILEVAEAIKKLS